MSAEQKKNDATTFVKDLLMGGTSGIIAKTACAPLERVKILLQTQHATTTGTKYNGFLDAFVRLPKEQGVPAFWRGNLANCLRYFPTQAMNFAFKERYQKMFVRPREEVGFAQWFGGFLLAGGLAGATSLTVSYPLEYTYTRLAADTSGQYSGIVDCVVKTAKSEGVSGLYRGYCPSVAGIIVYRAGYFGIYDFSKEFVLPMLPIKEGESPALDFLVKFILAFNIDILSSLCAYPLDTIRRSMMMMSGRTDKPYTSSLGCARHIMKNNGVAGFYKGAFTNSIRAIGSALVLVLYDKIKVMVNGPAAKKSGGH